MIFCFALPFTIFSLNVFFLYLHGGFEQDAAEIAGGTRDVNPARVTGLDEQRQASGMIQMCVGQNRRIKILRREGKRLAVTRLVLPAVLDQATIDRTRV